MRKNINRQILFDFLCIAFTTFINLNISWSPRRQSICQTKSLSLHFSLSGSMVRASHRSSDVCGLDRGLGRTIRGKRTSTIILSFHKHNICALHLFGYRHDKRCEFSNTQGTHLVFSLFLGAGSFSQFTIVAQPALFFYLSRSSHFPLTLLLCSLG